jgi:hypothetical protein
VRLDSDQWRGACASSDECFEAAWHRPRGLARVTTLSPASDWRSLVCIGMHA